MFTIAFPNLGPRFEGDSPVIICDDDLLGTRAIYLVPGWTEQPYHNRCGGRYAVLGQITCRRTWVREGNLPGWREEGGLASL